MPTKYIIIPGKFCICHKYYVTYLEERTFPQIAVDDRVNTRISVYTRNSDLPFCQKDKAAKKPKIYFTGYINGQPTTPAYLATNGKKTEIKALAQNMT